jgi:uncharacterized protein
MRCHLLLLSSLVTALLYGASAAAQTGLVGVWTGQWERDGSRLAVEMTFTHTALGYEGAFSSLQLRVVGIPLSRVRYEPPAWSCEIVGDETTSVFEGTLKGDTLSGVFREGKASGTFTLTRGKPTAVSVRESEVTFANGPVILSGTVVSPGGPGPFPGVVFLHGSGAEGRWASRYLAHEFARRGIASLIYDKRGVGRSTGDWRTAGFRELVQDASAAVEALRAQAVVAQRPVGIYGHSQGGAIAPWVAHENRHVAFIVAAAAPGVSMADLERYSIENSMNIRGLPAAEQPPARQYAEALVAVAYEGAPRSELVALWERVKDRPWAFAPPPASDPYWSFSRGIASYNPLDLWRQVSVPALLVYGEDDARVPARRSAVRIAEAYLGAKGPGLEVIFLPLADHNYRLPQNAAGKFAWPRTAPGFPDRMIDWVSLVSKDSSRPGGA